MHFFKDFFLFICQREREHKEREGQAEEEEKGSPLSKGLDVGLDPRTLGS